MLLYCIDGDDDSDVDEEEEEEENAVPSSVRGDILKEEGKG